jgi:hypothetical protein
VGPRTGPYTVEKRTITFSAGNRTRKDQVKNLKSLGSKMYHYSNLNTEISTPLNMLVPVANFGSIF